MPEAPSLWKCVGRGFPASTQTPLKAGHLLRRPAASYALERLLHAVYEQVHLEGGLVDRVVSGEVVHVDGKLASWLKCLYFLNGTF